MARHSIALGNRNHQRFVKLRRARRPPRAEELKRDLVPDPHQNTLAAMVEVPAGWKPLRASFSASAGDRASIYACKAFNTEERVGSNYACLGGGKVREPQRSAQYYEGGASVFVISARGPIRILYMSSEVPAAIRGQKYISLGTFRKSGQKIATPVWFGEDGNKLYVMTRSDMGKTKRIRNNPQVRVAPCTIRGKVTGPEFGATARILSPQEHPHARKTLNRKYWMARLPWVWRRTDTYIELAFE